MRLSKDAGLSPLQMLSHHREKLAIRRELFRCVHFEAFGQSLIGGTVSELPIVFVIEDDDAIQDLVEAALTDAGFEAAIATSGEEAVTLLKARAIPYRALVTDIRLLGRFDGWEVARAARQVDPDFPVVYMSGLAADDWKVQGVPNSIMLQKPFAPAQLVTALSQLLNNGPFPTSQVT